MADDTLTFDDDAFVLADDLPFEDDDELSYHVLLVDDEPDVHAASVFSIGSTKIDGRDLKFHSCFTGGEAVTYLKSHPETSVVFMDIVMESPTAGLDAVETIRSCGCLDSVRLIVRTGQPGNATQIDVISKYHADDMIMKSNVSREVLITKLISNIRTSELIRSLIKKGARPCVP